MKKKKIIAAIYLLMFMMFVFNESKTAKAETLPLVALWTPWNYLALHLDEIEQIPTNKINTVQLSFNPPLYDGIEGTRIKEAIQRIHNRGMKVIAFVGMEIAIDDYNQKAQIRGDEYPHNFQVALQADGTPILKGDSYRITSILDEEYKAFYARKFQLLREAGADFVVVGENGYSMNRTITTEALNQFVAETGTYLPTTELGATLSTYLTQNPSVGQKLWIWKWSYLFSWLSSLGTVDSAARWSKDCPVYPGQKINSVAGFLANDPSTADTYTTILNKINSTKVEGALNVSQIQYYIGNTGTPTPYPEDIFNRAKFLAQNAQGFEFYGSQYFLQYKDFVQYLPNLADYNPAPTPTYSKADINQDTLINATDFNILKTDFLKLAASLSNPKSDIDGDGQCTVRDAGILMSGWKP